MLGATGNKFQDTVRILGGQPTDIYLKNVSVVGAHASGIKVFSCNNILVQDGTVQGTTGDGYSMGGTAIAPASTVVFRGAKAISNGKDGFVVPSTNNVISDITFDRTVAQGNGVGTTEDGYDIRGSTAVPSPTPIVRFLDAEATANSQAGFKVWSSAQFENVYAALNTDAGMTIGRTGVGHTVVSVLNSTVKGNGSPQINVSALGIDLSLYNTLVTGNETVLLKYSKGYTGAETGGGKIDWQRDLLSRTSASGVVVRYYDRSDTGFQDAKKHDCLKSDPLATCDATGDCNYNFQVTVDEQIIMVNITLGNFPLSSCYQGDFNGDGQITVDEIIRATNITLTDDAHNGTLTSAPSFQADGRHLQASSPGSNAGLTPSSFGSVCRAGSCDADSHGRPDGSGYDVGAYEGTGQQSTSATCLNVAPGACIAGAALLSSLGEPRPEVAAASRTKCPGQPVRVPFTLTGGASAVRGIQLDIVYDNTVLEVPRPSAACKLSVPGSHGSVYTAALTNAPADTGRLRVLIVDLDGKPFDDGDLITCQFRVLPGAAPGIYRLGFDQVVVAGPDAGVLESTLAEPQVEVLSSCATATEEQ